ncbi:MAG: twin-arginine translocase TatA/TatE family subunit [Anaerolineales bacterium]|nr:twin-arginine translocase TatA/TatE family subunit [Anaerolineales bacterium]
MEILGVGPSELIFIVIIALIVLGPKDMQKAGRTIGKFLRNIVTSDGWKMWQQTSRELRTLPNRLMREANEELDKVGNEINNSISPALGKERFDQSQLKKPVILKGSQPVPTHYPVPSKPVESQPAAPETDSTSTPSESETNKDA